jgi:hypothetical protein
MATPVNERRLKDATFIKSAALPNAANTVNGGALDLGTATPFSVTEKLQLQISLTAANGANNKNINIRVQDSADNSSWANVAVFANPLLQSTDNNGAGHTANSVKVALPPTIRRYVRAVAVGEANGGDSSAGTFKAELLF